MSNRYYFVTKILFLIQLCLVIQVYSKNIVLKETIPPEKYASVGPFDSGIRKVIFNLYVFDGQANITFISENGYKLFQQNQNYKIHNFISLIMSGSFDKLQTETATILFRQKFYVLIGNVGSQKNILVVGEIKSMSPQKEDTLNSVILGMLPLLLIVMLCIIIRKYTNLIRVPNL